MVIYHATDRKNIMTTIEIAYEVDATAVERVKALLDETARNNCNWNGTEFKIVRGDFTCIPDDESAEAVQLYNAIMREIEGNDDYMEDDAE